MKVLPWFYAKIRVPKSTAELEIRLINDGKYSMATLMTFLLPHPLLATLGRLIQRLQKPASTAILAFALMQGGPATAAETGMPVTQTALLKEAQKLLNSKQYDKALDLLKSYVRRNEQDLQGRFLLGVTLSESGQDQDAIAVMTQLTEDFPEVPEPYNNLGVLYARQADLEQARQVLEMAIRANPNYAIAHENLGDIYARLAATQYRKAQALDTINKPLSKKLQTLDEVVATPPQIYVPRKISPSSSTSSVPF